MRSLFYVTCVLKELASRHPEFQRAYYKAELVGWEIVHLGLIPRKSIPSPSSHEDQSSEWLIKEIDGTLASISLGASQKYPNQCSRIQNVIDEFEMACSHFGR